MHGTNRNFWDCIGSQWLNVLRRNLITVIIQIYIRIVGGYIILSAEMKLTLTIIMQTLLLLLRDNIIFMLSISLWVWIRGLVLGLINMGLIFNRRLIIFNLRLLGVLLALFSWRFKAILLWSMLLISLWGLHGLRLFLYTFFYFIWSEAEFFKSIFY